MTSELVCQNNQTNLIVPTTSSISITSTAPSVILTPNQIELINTAVRTGNQVIINHRGEIAVQRCTATTSSTFINTYFTGTPTTSTITTTGTYSTTPYGLWYNSYPSTFVPKKLHYIKKTTKNSIKRALKLMSNFGMENETRIFLGGEKVEISHSDSIFKFVIEKHKNNLIHATEYCGVSTPYKLGLYTKSNIHIANLCVIFRETPLLDQVFGLSMFVKNGEENRILEKANFYSINTDKEILKAISIDNPMLQKKLKLDHITIQCNIH